jgi:hypothetical protein
MTLQHDKKDLTIAELAMSSRGDKRMQTTFTNGTETIHVYLKYIQLYYDLCTHHVNYRHYVAYGGHHAFNISNESITKTVLAVTVIMWAVHAYKIQ